MPFYIKLDPNTGRSDYHWAPDGSDELAGMHQRDLMADTSHANFFGSTWCALNMWNEYYVRHPDLGQPWDPPQPFTRNPHARCYPQAARPWNGAPPPPPPPEPIAEYVRKDVVVSGKIKTPYFMPYDTLDEVVLRLGQSVIKLDGEPVYIARVDHNGRNNGYKLDFYTADSEVLTSHVYKDERSGFDLSPFTPRYGYNTEQNRKAIWVFRKPVRNVYKQGATRHNTFYRNAGGAAEGSLGSHTNILQAYKKENELRGAADYVKKLSDAKPSIPLSNHISLVDLGTHAKVEYHGMTLGKFRKELINSGFKPAVEITPWMQASLSAVGLSVK